MEMSNLLKEMFESEGCLCVQSFTSSAQRGKDVYVGQQIHVTFLLVFFSMKSFQYCSETAQLCLSYLHRGRTNRNLFTTFDKIFLDEIIMNDFKSYI